MNITMSQHNGEKFYKELRKTFDNRESVSLFGVDFLIDTADCDLCSIYGTVKFNLELVEKYSQKVNKSSIKGLMQYDPVTGEKKDVFPSEAEQYRKWHGEVAWLYNPYTGKKRDARDIGSDVFGHLIEG